jgi:hypothetical protein
MQEFTSILTHNNQAADMSVQHTAVCQYHMRLAIVAILTLDTCHRQCTQVHVCAYSYASVRHAYMHTGIAQSTQLTNAKVLAIRCVQHACSGAQQLRPVHTHMTLYDSNIINTYSTTLYRVHAIHLRAQY